jgi:hypothetical protein
MATTRTLFDLWYGYIVAGHRCPQGLAALDYLRGMAAKGTISNKALWDGASPEIKTGFRSQFGDEHLPKAMQKLVAVRETHQNCLKRLSNVNIKTGAVVEALKAAVVAYDAAITKASPKTYPVPLSDNLDSWRVRWVSRP